MLCPNLPCFCSVDGFHGSSYSLIAYLPFSYQNMILYPCTCSYTAVRYIIVSHNYNWKSGKAPPVKEIQMKALSSFADLLKKVNKTTGIVEEVKCGSEVISNHSSMLHERSDVVNKQVVIHIGESGLYLHSGLTCFYSLH